MAWSDFANTVQNKSGKPKTNLNSYSNYEYYTFVIGIKNPDPDNPEFTDIRNYVPRGLKTDSKGEFIPSSFKSSNKSSRYQDMELGRWGDNSIEDTEVVKWSTPNPVLSELSREHKAACNAFKAWLIKTPAAFWWHNANPDRECKYGGPHFHIIKQSIPVGDGKYQRLNTGAPYKTFKDAIAASGGYVYSATVKDLGALVLYLNTPPRQFMGSMCPKIGAIRRMYNECGTEWSSGYDDAVSEWFDDIGAEDPVDRECSDGGPRRNAFELTEEVRAMVARVQKRKLDAGFAPGPSADDSIRDFEGPSTKRDKCDYLESEHGSVGRMEMPKCTSKTKLVETLERIMYKYNKYDKEALQTWAYTLPTHDKARVFIESLTRQNLIQQYTDNARETLKVAAQPLKMIDFATKAKDSSWYPEDLFYSIGESLRLWTGWARSQNISPSKLVRNIQAVYDMHKVKINTLVVKGESDSGKSTFINEPLQDLHPHYASYSTTSNEDRFAFSEFPGKRVAFAHEGTFGPTLIETAKMIWGGQTVDVDVKHKNRVRVYRIPFFINSQHDPWMYALNDADKQALRNRCFYYEVKKNADVPPITKKLHPGMWYYLLMGVENDYDDTKYYSKELMEGHTDSVPEVDSDIEYEIE